MIHESVKKAMTLVFANATVDADFGFDTATAGQESEESIMLRKGKAGPGDEPGKGGRRGADGPKGDAGPDRYKMRENLVSIGDDFWIETQRGRRAYHVDGKALRIRDTLKFEDAQGRELYEIQTKLVPLKETMAVTKGNREMAVVKKAFVSPLRDRLNANMAGGPDIDIRGNLLSHEYTMERRGKRVAEVSKKWLAIADTYTVEIAGGEDDALILALCVVIDQICKD